MSGTSVTEIHRYPLRPPGFEEPLFATDASKRAVAEHLLASPWLLRASDLAANTGTAAHAREESVQLHRQSGQVVVVRARPRRCSWRRRRVVEVVARWRDIRRWWGNEPIDRLLFRVAVGDGELVDLALDRSRGWLLVGVVD